jgi:Ni/Co efflux regulator RcnB
MPTLRVMATTSVGNQPFARIVESRKTSSWSIGIPIAIVVVLAVALLAYFAAKATQAREELAANQQSAQQSQQQLTQVQQKLAQVDAELNRLRDPGRTTVILQSASTGKRGKAAEGAWGAATWGEQTDGKSWMRLNAYGLTPPPAGRTYQLWFVSTSGDSILVGKIDAGSDGSAYLEGKDLPAVDQGKTALVSLDEENAKTHGAPVFQAQLPKLTPLQHAAPAQAQSETKGAQNDANAPAAKPQPAQK